MSVAKSSTERGLRLLHLFLLEDLFLEGAVRARKAAGGLAVAFLPSGSICSLHQDPRMALAFQL